MKKELPLNIREIISKIESHYHDTFNLIAKIGNKIDEKLRLTPNDNKLIIGRDILKRIQTNINVLLNIKISEHTVVAYRLILRAMFADIVEAIYLVASAEKELEEELWKRNLEAARTFEIWVKEKKEFYEKVDTQDTTNIDLDKMYATFVKYVNPDSPKEFYSKNKNKKIDTASMASCLKKHPAEIFYYVNQLYAHYRFLSLTEHYTTAFRANSYLRPEDYLMFEDFSAWIFLGSKIFAEILTEIVDTGTIKFILSDGTILYSI
ncbi:hypothetical protein ED375_12210 [Muribaculaceae bacterium Isolate-004 (NCI)]|uniref:hypothetical protein n=1 Tax=Muribaculum sp. NM65_B17 TaxID=2516961 RepID=UPI000FFEBD89|nr:hypothetical protein [Muribaculum sp. NM65_B17]RXE60975.1 hypothetical protein ED375_12210 [Muribaculaceae bacterium Isolate-004 (NCI)]TGY04999.1 hypothetical protein E5354_02890 [Muribaculum sp. NM65_B17]THG44763.1 hypothetical protein E5985_01930 [Muribaculaceae bacterium]